MKLKQKLADESANEWYENPEISSKYDYVQAYLTGFEKALEMAVKEYDTFEYGKKDLRQRIKNLGEEEVLN